MLHEVEEHQIKVLNEFLKTLGETGIKTFIVPGKNDAPLRVYLRALAQMEDVYPNLRCVHETFANWGSEFVVNPGPMCEGYFAVIDVQEKKVEYGDLR